MSCGWVVFLHLAHHAWKWQRKATVDYNARCVTRLNGLQNSGSLWVHTLLPTDTTRCSYVPWNSRPCWAKLPVVNPGVSEEGREFASAIFCKPAASWEIRCHNVCNLPNPRQGWREPEDGSQEECKKFFLMVQHLWSGQCSRMAGGSTSRARVDYSLISPTATSQGWNSSINSPPQDRWARGSGWRVNKEIFVPRGSSYGTPIQCYSIFQGSSAPFHVLSMSCQCLFDTCCTWYQRVASLKQGSWEVISRAPNSAKCLAKWDFFFPSLTVPLALSRSTHTYARLCVGLGINPSVKLIPKGGQKTEGYKREREWPL